jgi:DNA polymerase-1
MSEAQNHLYLVDGSSYIFRAYHRLPPLTNRPRHACRRRLWLYRHVVEAGRRPQQGDGPTHMAVILDASEETHRNKMYDQYKANRPPPPEDWSRNSR